MAVMQGLCDPPRCFTAKEILIMWSYWLWLQMLMVQAWVPPSCFASLTSFFPHTHPYQAEELIAFFHKEIFTRHTHTQYDQVGVGGTIVLRYSTHWNREPGTSPSLPTGTRGLYILFSCFKEVIKQPTWKHMLHREVEIIPCGVIPTRISWMIKN